VREQVRTEISVVFQGGIMQSQSFSQAFVSCASLATVLLLTLLLSTAASSKDGRDFMAYYRIDEVSQVSDAVQIKIQLKLFNYSGSDIRQGKVALYDSQPTRLALGGFKPIKLFRTRGEANLIQQFTISKIEYERWQHGVNPVLFFLFTDSNGHTLQRPIELIRRPLPPIEAGQ
jgi:hypothetical protein